MHTDFLFSEIVLVSNKLCFKSKLIIEMLDFLHSGNKFEITDWELKIYHFGFWIGQANSPTETRIVNDKTQMNGIVLKPK